MTTAWRGDSGAMEEVVSARRPALRMKSLAECELDGEAGSWPGFSPTKRQESDATLQVTIPLV